MPSLPLLKTNRRPSAAIARFVAAFEGGASSDGKFRPYYDRAGGVWTQGFGHTEGVRASSPTWTRAKAVAVLKADLDGPRYGGKVRAFLRSRGIKLSQKQFDALLSVVYNAGPGVLGSGWRLGRSLRGSRTNRAAWRARVAEQWRTTAVTGAASGPTPLAGLVRRRKAEAGLWMGGRYGA